MQRAHRRHEPDRAVAALGERGADVGDRAVTITPAPLRHRVTAVSAPARRTPRAVRRGRGDRRAMPLDRLPVAALDRAGQLEAVLDHAPHQRLERLGRRVGRLEQLAGDAAQRDEVVRGDRGARVVEGAPFVVEHEGPQAERLGEPGAVSRASSVSPVTAAQAPSSCSAPRSWVNVCSGWSEKRRTCGASAASGVRRSRARPTGPARSRRDLGDRPVGDAEQEQLGASSRTAMPRSVSRALTALPTRPRAPMTTTLSIIRAPVPCGYRAVTEYNAWRRLR